MFNFAFTFIRSSRVASGSPWNLFVLAQAKDAAQHGFAFTKAFYVTHTFRGVVADLLYNPEALQFL